MNSASAPTRLAGLDVVTPITPPAPQVPATDLPTWRLVARMLESSLGVWPDYAFDVLVNKRTTLGLSALLVNDPEWVRYVLTANAANYRRPSTIRRVALPVGGNGLFLAEGTDWRRQRRILAPAFTQEVSTSLCRTSTQLRCISSARLANEGRPT